MYTEENANLVFNTNLGFALGVFYSYNLMQEHPAPNDEADRPQTGSRAGHQSCQTLLEIIFLLLLILSLQIRGS